MSLAKSLYELQLIDLDNRKKEVALSETEKKIGESVVLISAREKLTSVTDCLLTNEKEQQGIQWQVDDLESKIKATRQKLFSGKIANPKELVNLEHELAALQKRLNEMEERLLDLMSQTDSLKSNLTAREEDYREIESGWKKEQRELAGYKETIRTELDFLKLKRDELVSMLNRDSLNVYEKLRTTKGQAVVRVEQGLCLGCRLNLSVVEMQRTRGGGIVHCSNCGRILYCEY